MRITVATALVAALALALPAAANAATVGVKDGTLTYTGESGERNDLGIERVGQQYELYDNAGANRFSIKENGYSVTYGPGCRRRNADNDFPIVCDAAGVKRIRVSLATRSDALRLVNAIPVPVTYAGGSGRDAIRYFSNPAPAPIAISADGKADDGPDAQDNILTDVESLFGSSLGDSLLAAPIGGELTGEDGDDTLRGGAGNDKVKAAYVEDVGEDSGAFYSRGTDTVTCGRGNDQVFADRVDVISDDCEVIGKPTPPGSQNYAYRYVGSARADTIALDEFVERAIVLAGGGNDRIQGGFVYELRGERGSDRIDARGYLNLVYGGSGNDVIYSNERREFKYRDTIRCGSGTDRVYADKKDRVSRDCERVSRR